MVFRRRLILIQSIAALFIALFCVLTNITAIDKVLMNDKFHETRNLATTLAINPNIIKAVNTQNRTVLRNIFTNKGLVDVDFVVITNDKGQRLFHSDPNKSKGTIHGQKFKDVIELGKVTTEMASGLSGITIKTRAPIYNETNIIGMISVGFLESHVKNMAVHYFLQVVVLVILLLLVMLLCSKVFSHYIQNKLSGMTPEQIAKAYQLRRGILNSVAEGVVAVDATGKIMIINHQALTTLGIEQQQDELIGCASRELFYPNDFFIPHNQDEETEVIIQVNGQTLIASRTIMINANNVIGYVVSFRLKDSSAMLKLMLSQAAKERDNMRVITHEYANNMAVVSGMLEMGLHERALQFIHRENQELQDDIGNLTRHFHPVVAALILGKKRRANELGYTLNIVDGSTLSLHASPLEADKIAAMLGNLIDNAFESAAKTDRTGYVEVFITDVGAEIVIEVSDNGIGISDEKKAQIFNDGYTSKLDKSAPHGIGLALIKRLTEEAHGEVLVDDNDDNGVIISLFLPKKLTSPQLTKDSFND